MGQDEESIRKLIGDFTLAVESGTKAEVMNLMCPEDAKHFDLYYEEDPEAEPEQPDPDIDVRVDNVVINGDAASATVQTANAAEPSSLYFRKMEGRWTVCMYGPEGMPESGDTPGSTTPQ
ncbi:hypothetical protein SAMN05660657_03193 [Geodermatophilus amargosae]|uniref:DUF4878 domain-containing protein n=1 Tax=Geodermatophilus amargosae TaxID=1296565 RepID=A0A1I7AZZ6_9ACTN|nr:hypothetical protein [Geodermatophilus amargosae]SFT80500.1 hypothetical protein SAMN05660657_03193 [Geodermatophilus amargosae]